jgi:ABC-type glutathione transport system ATPase component
VRILGTDVLGAPRRTLRDLRGRVVGLVGQHGASAFDPLFPVGFQLDEAVRAHARMAAPERRERVRESLARAGLALGPGALAAPPGRLSGGMVQRAQVAAAILHHPPLLIADEPTAALDTVRRRGLAALLADLKAGGTAILLVTHDLGLAAAVADEIVVLHGGRIVDRGDPARVLAAPADPATTALVAAWRAVDGSGQPPWTGEGGAR